MPEDTDNVARFISKHAHYRLSIRGELRGADTLLPGGVVQKNITKPPLELEFRLLAGITKYEQEYAYRHFAGLSLPRHDGSGGFLGADPAAYTQPMFREVDGRREMVGETMAFDPRNRFSVFDTSWVAEDDREFALMMLRTGPTVNLAYVEIIAAAIPAPWPSYDDIGQGAVAKIASLTRDLGLNPILVAQYEEAHKNRPGVLAALAALTETIVEDAADEDALERVIQ